MSATYGRNPPAGVYVHMLLLHSPTISMRFGGLGSAVLILALPVASVFFTVNCGVGEALGGAVVVVWTGATRGVRHAARARASGPPAVARWARPHMAVQQPRPRHASSRTFGLSEHKQHNGMQPQAQRRGSTCTVKLSSLSAFTSAEPL